MTQSCDIVIDNDFNLSEFAAIFFICLSGVEILNKAITKLVSKGTSTWRTILIEISISNIRITDCTVRTNLLRVNCHISATCLSIHV